MKIINQDRKYQIGQAILLLVFFLLAFIICNRIPFSDGDDAYFLDMAHRMGFFEYLQMRYAEWTGRMTSEAMTWLAFRLGHGFWAFANAIILTLLPVGLARIAKTMREKATEKKGLRTLIISSRCDDWEKIAKSP